MNIFIYIPNAQFYNAISELVRVFFPRCTLKVLDPNRDNIKSDDYLLTVKYSYLNKQEIMVYSEFKSQSVSPLGYNTEKLKLEGNWNSKEIKRELKKVTALCVFHMLTEFTGRQPYWGILTGVRPLKLIHHLIEQGLEERELINTLYSQYRINHNKAKLLIETARNQKPVLLNTKNNLVSIYIHIPLCTTKCLYCSFPSAVIDRCRELIDPYLDCLILELQQIIGILIEQRSEIQSIYIGGGTPTALSLPQLKRLLEAIAGLLQGQQIQEYTVECGRPDSIHESNLSLLKSFGVGRISINPQTMNEETLIKIGRKHSVQQVISKFHMARDMGFDCINTDIIVGLPHEDMHHIEKTMEAIACLEPDNVTVHSLAIKRASRLKESLEEYPLISDDVANDMLQVCVRWVKDMGLIPYYLYRQKYTVGNLENVGYTKPGKACIYNIQMMGERQTIWAFGAGAVTKIYYPHEGGIERIPNVKDIREYINRIEEMVYKKKKVLSHS